MSEVVTVDLIEPRLRAADGSADVDTRLGILDPISCFPLAADGWFAVAGSAHLVLTETEPGTAERRRALDVAVRVPLLTFRSWLRKIAADPNDPDHLHLAERLADLGDPSQIPLLLEAAREGRPGAFEQLAAMPLEETDVRPDDIPVSGEDEDPDAPFWRAIALARIGSFEPLVELIEATDEPEIVMFDADPWAPHNRLAAVRPIPTRLHTYLLHGLTMECFNETGQRVVWGLTGIADAFGEPTEEDELTERVESAGDQPPTSDVQAAEAREAAARLLSTLSTPEDSVGLDLESLAHLNHEEAQELAVSLVREANRVTAGAEGPSDPAFPTANRVLDAMVHLPVGRMWPVRDLAALAVDDGALDHEQMAWVIGRAPIRHAFGELIDLIMDAGSDDRDRLVALARAVADLYSGRAGSPWRGAGGETAGGAPGSGPLIDDTPEMAAREPEPELPQVIHETVSSPGPVSIDPDPRTGEIPTPESPGGRSTGTPPSRRPMSSPDPNGPVALGPAPTPRGGGSILSSIGSMIRSVFDLRTTTFTGSATDDTGEVTVTEEPEQRRVVAQIRHDDIARKTFYAGEQNVIRCWIGTDTPAVGGVANHFIPQVTTPPEGINLDVVLLWNDQTDRQTIHLPANRSARSSECDLAITVPEGERFISADVAFLYRGRVFEVVKIEAFVLQPGEIEQAHHTIEVKVQLAQREVTELEDSQVTDAVVMWGESGSGPAARDGGNGSRKLVVFDSRGGKGLDLSDASTAISFLNNELFATSVALVRQREREGVTVEELDSDNKDVLFIMRELARHGATLYNTLTSQEFKDPGRRFQLLNTDPKEYAPVEFVYDRGYPTDDATICTAGLVALDGDADDCPHCPSAADLDPQQRMFNPTICPFGFWSLQKIMERRDPPSRAAASDSHGSVPRAGRRQLPPIDSVLFASNHRVPAAEQTATMAALKDLMPHADQATSWRDWVTKLATNQPGLLIALPHHGATSGRDYLEIGAQNLPDQERLLSRGQLIRAVVNPTGQEPGPIVLLLGCHTLADTEIGYAPIARRFQQLPTSIVLGTLAKVLGRQAAPAARELASQLAAVDDPDSDFGTIMRRVRRRMLKRGYLMALCLVALGDGEWRLTPRN